MFTKVAKRFISSIHACYLVIFQDRLRAVVEIDISGCFNVTDDGILWLAKGLRGNNNVTMVSHLWEPMKGKGS